MLRAIELSLKEIRAEEAQHSNQPPADHTPQSSAARLCPERLLARPGGSSLTSFAGQRQLPIRERAELPPEPLSHSSSPSNQKSTFGPHSQSSKRLTPPSSGGSDSDAPSPTRKRKTSNIFEFSRQAEPLPSSSQSSQSTTSPTFIISDDEDLPPPPRRRKSGHANDLTPARRRPQQPAVRSRKATSRLSARQVFMRNGLNASSVAAPDGDVIGEDL